MFKAVLVVVAALIVAPRICSGTCRFSDKVRPVHVNIDELARRRLNGVYLTETKGMSADHYYIDMIKVGDHKHVAIHTVVHENNSTITSKGTVTYKRGIMYQTFQNPDNSRKYNKIRWYFLARSSEDAMLVYLCEKHASTNDYRMILVPSNNTLSGESRFKLVSSDDILSHSSWNQLMSVDKSYNFTGKLTKLPHALQDLQLNK